MEENDCECLRCGWIWISRVEKPKRCPGCQSTRWKIPYTNKTAVSNQRLNEPSSIIGHSIKRPEIL